MEYQDQSGADCGQLPASYVKILSARFRFFLIIKVEKKNNKALQRLSAVSRFLKRRKTFSGFLNTQALQKKNKKPTQTAQKWAPKGDTGGLCCGHTEEMVVWFFTQWMWTARACLLYVEVKTSCDDCVWFPLLFRARLKTADTRQIGGCVSSKENRRASRGNSVFFGNSIKNEPLGGLDDWQLRWSPGAAKQEEDCFHVFTRVFPLLLGIYIFI